MAYGVTLYDVTAWHHTEEHEMFMCMKFSRILRGGGYPRAVWWNIVSFKWSDLDDLKTGWQLRTSSMQKYARIGCQNLPKWQICEIFMSQRFHALQYDVTKWCHDIIWRHVIIWRQMMSQNVSSNIIWRTATMVYGVVSYDVTAWRHMTSLHDVITSYDVTAWCHDIM